MKTSKLPTFDTEMTPFYRETAQKDRFSETHDTHCRDYSTTEFKDYVCEVDCPVGGYQAKSLDLRR